MTIVLNGFPGEYRDIPTWLRQFLILELNASANVLDLLTHWATDPTAHPYADWAAAVDAAAKQLNERPVIADDATYGRALIPVVLHATRVAQDLYDLTGASTDKLNWIQNGIGDDCTKLLNAAAAVPAAVRNSVRSRDLDGFMAQTESPRKYRDWERTPTLTLVHHPMLVSIRPMVLPPGGTDAAMLFKSLLALTAEVTRVSATARLDAKVGPATVAGTFTANSGNSPVEYRHDVPHPTRNETIEYIDRVNVTAVYDAFPATAERDGMPTARDLDAEKKIFDLVHSLLRQSCTSSNVGMHEVTGTLTIATGIRMCASCFMVGMQFLTNFPRLQISVSRLP